MNVPANLRYTASHEWLLLEGDVATIGITDHAQEELTDVVFVELPELGRNVDAGTPTAVVESVKAASDIHAPVGGEIVALNEEVDASPELVNEKPYGVWLFKIKPTSDDSLASDLSQLLTLETYNAGPGS